MARSCRKGDLFVVKLRVRSGESIQEAVRRFRKLVDGEHGVVSFYQGEHLPVGG